MSKNETKSVLDAINALNARFDSFETRLSALESAKVEKSPKKAAKKTAKKTAKADKDYTTVTEKQLKDLKFTYTKKECRDGEHHYFEVTGVKKGSAKHEQIKALGGKWSSKGKYWTILAK